MSKKKKDKIKKLKKENEELRKEIDQFRSAYISVVADYIVLKYGVKNNDNELIPFSRLMMTTVKKNYASLIGVQEGNMVPEDKQLDVKGIECLTKSSKSQWTFGTLYSIGDICIYNENYYICKRKHISSADFENDINNWVKIGKK